MTDKKFNVLFLCTGNSARSIMAEVLLQRWGSGKFNAFSAGSIPKGRVHPMTIKLLKMNNFRTDELRSKCWDEFSGPDVPPLDFIFTVCDKAAKEVCPIWPGQPMTAHWGIEDPDQEYATEEEQFRKFKTSFWELDNRIKIFTSLPFDKLDTFSLQKHLDEIGKIKLEDNTIVTDLLLSPDGRSEYRK